MAPKMGDEEIAIIRGTGKIQAMGIGVSSSLPGNLAPGEG
jgi:hypothetical protein